ncbi:MAG: flagellar basal-body MS-ring/collar protein FliF [Caulobacterales bacterium]
MSFLDSLRTSSPRRQLIFAVGGVAIIGAVLIAAYFLVLRKPYAVLFANLRTVDAATIVADLDKKKIPYRLEAGGTTILVPQNRMDSTRLAEMTEDLPLKGEVGFELFNKSDMGLTEFAQRINYQRALQGELARTIMTMDSIDSARVHLALAEPSVFRDERRPSKASVTLLARPGKEIEAGAVRGIQRLVAAAIPDLAVDDVVVLDGRGETVSSSMPAGVAASPLAQQKQAIELYYAARIRQALAAVYAGGPEVTVTARTEPSTSSIDGDEPGLANWTPAARGFPLDVTVSFSSPPSGPVEAQVRAIAARAIGPSASSGDVITISTAAPAWNAPATAPAGRETGVAKSTRVTSLSSPASFWLSILVPLLVALLAIASWLVWRGRGPRALSTAQRNALSLRLQTLLDQEDVSAAPSA